MKDQIKTCKEKGEANKCKFRFYKDQSALSNGRPSVFEYTELAKDKRAKQYCNWRSYVYIQAPCVIPSKYKAERQIFGLLVGCIGVFTYLYTLSYMDYVACVQKNKYIDYDVRTITAADYSVEFPISAEQYEYWKKHYL